MNDLAIVDRGERTKDGVIVVAAVGKEHRLGSWKVMEHGKNYSVLFEVPRKALSREESSDTAEADAEDKNDEFGGFE